MTPARSERNAVGRANYFSGALLQNKAIIVAAYCILYIMLMSTFGIFSIPRAYATTCSTSGHFYAYGNDGDTYSDYGTTTHQTIYDQTICGTSSDKSGLAVFIADFFSGGDFVATGYFKGEYGDGTAYTTSLDYYYDKSVSSSYAFSDISSWAGHNPTAGQAIQFSLQGSLNDGTHTWYVSITHLNDYTINPASFSGDADYGSGPTAQLESHNNANTGTGDLYSLQNLKYTNPNWAWTSWTSGSALRSPTGSSNPYCPTQVSVTEYSMRTITSGSC